MKVNFANAAKLTLCVALCLTFSPYGKAQPSVSAPRTVSETWDISSPQGPYRIFIERTEKYPQMVITFFMCWTGTPSFRSSSKRRDCSREKK